MNVLEIQEWLESIQHDIETVQLIIKENGHADIGIYHLHQAVEKYLKILFLLLEKEFPRIHFLDRLYSILIQDYSQLEKILSDIIFIDQYLPKLRYPTGDKLEHLDLIHCWDHYRNIEQVLKEILSNKIIKGGSK